MAVKQEPDAQINLGYLDEFDSIDSIKIMCHDMYDINNLKISDTIKHKMNINVLGDTQVWMLKYGKHVKVGTRTDKDNWTDF